MTHQTELSIAQVRRWEHPPPWAVNGYSATQDIFWLNDRERMVQLPAGGWTLNAADLIRLCWDGDPSEECGYWIDHNQIRIYRSRWLPMLNETVTESFFSPSAGDLFVINYRLLRVTVQ